MVGLKAPDHARDSVAGGGVFQHTILRFPATLQPTQPNCTLEDQNQAHRETPRTKKANYQKISSPSNWKIDQTTRPPPPENLYSNHGVTPGTGPRTLLFTHAAGLAILVALTTSTLTRPPNDTNALSPS